MASKRIVFNADTKKHLLNGINTAANAVKVTLGPLGQNVIIETEGLPHVTKDGVTVAGNLQLPNKYEDLGCRLLIDAASRTVRGAGDGTTSVMVLVQAIVNELLNGDVPKNKMDAIIRKLLPKKEQRNIRDVVSGMEAASKDVIDYVDNHKRAVTDNEQILGIATVSANNDAHIGGLIAKIYAEIGKDGIITTEYSQTADTHFVINDGLQINGGYLSNSFITNVEEAAAILEDCNIFVCNEKIESIHELLPFLQRYNSFDDYKSKPLLIIAQDYMPDVVATLVANKRQKGLQVCCIRCPQYTNQEQFFEDIAIMTGADVVGIRNNLPMLEASVANLGKAGRVKVKWDSTTFVDTKGDPNKIKDLMYSIDAEIKNSTIEYAKRDFKKRKARLTGNIATLFIGAGSDTEVTQKKDRIDDAIAAVKAAIEDGVIISTASFLLKVQQEMKQSKKYEEMHGYKIVADSLDSIFNQMITNAGIKMDEKVVNNVAHSLPSTGYNLVTRKICDMYDEYIIDPAKVMKLVIENSVSVAIMVATTGCAIVNEEEFL